MILDPLPYLTPYLTLIEEKLKLEWSPEQISGWLDLE